MQLTNDQISAVSLWMKEHGIDEHFIGVFEKEWMKEEKKGEVIAILPKDSWEAKVLANDPMCKKTEKTILDFADLLKV